MRLLLRCCESKRVEPTTNNTRGLKLRSLARMVYHFCYHLTIYNIYSGLCFVPMFRVQTGYVFYRGTNRLRVLPPLLMVDAESTAKTAADPCTQLR